MAHMGSLCSQKAYLGLVNTIQRNLRGSGQDSGRLVKLLAKSFARVWPGCTSFGLQKLTATIAGQNAFLPDRNAFLPDRLLDMFF